MQPSDIETIIKLWLEIAGRQLTEEQLIHLNFAYAKSPLPLFLKLSFDEALRWHSYDDFNTIQHSLQATVYDTINALFDRLEKTHGVELVTNYLGCITVCKY